MRSTAKRFGCSILVALSVSCVRLRRFLHDVRDESDRHTHSVYRDV